MISTLSYLQQLPKPKFNPNHQLIPISLAAGWSEEFPFEIRKELADYWGYGLFFGRVTHKNVEEAINNPRSVFGKVLQLAKSNPKKYPLDTYLDTQNFFRKPKINPSSYPDAFAHDNVGNLIKKFPNPEMRDETWQVIIEKLIAPLKRLADEGVNFNVIQHWSEWFIPVVGHNASNLLNDPLIKAKYQDRLNNGEFKPNSNPSYDSFCNYLHLRKAYYEKMLADEVKAIAPNRNSYNIYTLNGGNDYGRYGGWGKWVDFVLNIGETCHISDYPGGSFYTINGSFQNRGRYANQINDLLSRLLASRGAELAVKHQFNQPWVWLRETSKTQKYLGFLRCAFLAGARGFISYLEPDDKSNYIYSQEINELNPPAWVTQVVELGYLSAQFSCLDRYLLEGDLLEGPFPHRFWAQHQYWKNHSPHPSYCLDNPFEIMTKGGWKNAIPGKVRIVARKLRNQDKYLLCAWATDGINRQTWIELPNFGRFDVVAKPEGNLYEATMSSGELLQVEIKSGLQAVFGSQGKTLSLQEINEIPLA